MAETRGNGENYCFRQLPVASVGHRQPPRDSVSIRGRKLSLLRKHTQDLKAALLGPNHRHTVCKTGALTANLRAQETCNGSLIRPNRRRRGQLEAAGGHGRRRILRGRRMGHGQLFGKRGRIRHKRYKLGRWGRIVASVSYRRIPPDSVDIRCLRGWKMEVGELLGKRGRILPTWLEPRRKWGDY